MRLPSVRTLQERLNLKGDTPYQVRRRLEMFRDSPKEAPCQALMGVNDLLGGHGVEYLPSAQDTYRQANGLEYVNMGDTYAPTLLWDHAKGRFDVASWGDYVEAYPRRFRE